MSFPVVSHIRSSMNSFHSLTCALLTAALLVGCSSDDTTDDNGTTADTGQVHTDGGDVHDHDAHEHRDGGSGGDEDTGGDTTPLTSYDSWQTISANGDPLAEHRPETVECPDDSYGTETLNNDQTLTIDTGNCNYFAGRQQTIDSIEEGDQLRARIWHFELTASESATAHAALLIDGNVVWEKNVEIPAGSDLYAPEWTAKRSYPEGTPVVFHLHNHGSNSWNFIELVKTVNE